MKHPSIRVPAWSHVDLTVRAKIRDAVLSAVTVLPFIPKRVELFGSFVRGCSHLGSDWDINLAGKNWKEVEDWKALLLSDLTPYHAMMTALQPLMDELQVNIQVMPCNPDQNTYDISYDFLTDTFSDPKNKFPDKTFRRFNTATKKFDVFPLNPKRVEFDHDPFASEVPYWQTVYGAEFLTYHEEPIMNKDGSQQTNPRTGELLTKLVAD
jgi:hypothetical protein